MAEGRATRRAGCPSAVGAGMRKNRPEQLPGEILRFLAALGMTWFM